MINKIKLIKLKIIKDKRGDLLKYIDKKSNFYKKFGEIYFNEIKKNETKGWNYHKKNQCIITVPFGKVKFKFTNTIGGKVKVITIGRENYKAIVIPPKVWFNFTSVKKHSLVVNFIDNKHSKKETLKASVL